MRSEEVDAVRCAVVGFDQTYDDGGRRIDEFWIDEQGTLRRWVTTDFDRLDYLRSDRRYAEIRFDEAIPESEWSAPPGG